MSRARMGIMYFITMAHKTIFVLILGVPLPRADHDVEMSFPTLCGDVDVTYLSLCNFEIYGFSGKGRKSPRSPSTEYANERAWNPLLARRLTHFESMACEK